MGVLDVFALVAAIIFAAIALLGISRSSPDDHVATRGDLLRYAGVAALSFLAAAVMYVADLRGGGIYCLALANGALVFTPAALWASFRRVNGRGTGAVPAATGAGIAALGATFVLPGQGALFKLIAVTMFCALVAAESVRGRSRTLPGARVISAAALAYAVFTTARVAVALTRGVDSFVFRTLLSTQIATAVSVIGAVVVCIAVFAMARSLEGDTVAASAARRRARGRIEGGRMLRQHGGLVALVVSVPDIALVRAAFGAGHAAAVVRAMERAARDSRPDALVGPLSRDSVYALLPGGADHLDVDAVVRAAFEEHAPRPTDVDLPELRIVHRGIGDEAQLARFLSPAPLRRVLAQPAAPEG